MSRLAVRFSQLMRVSNEGGTLNSDVQLVVHVSVVYTGLVEG